MALIPWQKARDETKDYSCHVLIAAGRKETNLQVLDSPTCVGRPKRIENNLKFAISVIQTSKQKPLDVDIA